MRLREKVATLLLLSGSVCSTSWAQDQSDPLEFAAREQTTGPLVVGMYGNNFVGTKLGWIFESGDVVGGFTADVMRITPEAGTASTPARSRGIDAGASVYIFIPVTERLLLTVGDGFSFRASTDPNQVNVFPERGFFVHFFGGLEYRLTSWLHAGATAVVYVPLGDGMDYEGYQWSFGVMPHLAFRLW